MAGRSMGIFEPGIDEATQWDVAHADLVTGKIRLFGQGFVDNGQQLGTLLVCSVDRHPVALVFRGAQQAPDSGRNGVAKDEVVQSIHLSARAR